MVLQSELWATNSVLIPAGDACLVCDPSIFPEEIEEIRSATGGYEQVCVLVTHSDFDHVCGVPAFAGATVIAGPTTAAAVADGTARFKLDVSGREWGTAWEGGLHIDVVATPEGVRCGDAEVVAVESCGHIDDGCSFVLADRGILLPGDYLSSVCYPIVLASFEATVATLERLLAAIGEHGISIIVPGHGPVLDRHQARRIAREDIEYVRSVQAAAAEAVRTGASPNAALLAVCAVPPPRRARRDFEAFDSWSSNARLALAEAGHKAFTVPDPTITP